MRAKEAETLTIRRSEMEPNSTSHLDWTTGGLRPDPSQRFLEKVAGPYNAITEIFWRDDPKRRIPNIRPRRAAPMLGSSPSLEGLAMERQQCTTVNYALFCCGSRRRRDSLLVFNQ